MFTISVSCATAQEALTELVQIAGLLQRQQDTVEVTLAAPAKRISRKKEETTAVEPAVVEPLVAVVEPLVAVVEPATVETVAITAEHLRAYLSGFVKDRAGLAKVNELLAEFQVDRISSLAPDKFAAFKSRAIEVLA